VVESNDVGSLPLTGEAKRFMEGAVRYGFEVDDSAAYFERKIVGSFLDKAVAGIDVPNYPQFRDMNEMFLGTMDGLEKVTGGYVETETLSIKGGRGPIPEVSAIRRRSREIYERLGEPFKLKVCVTGPYTLSSLLIYKDKETFVRLGNTVAQIVEHSVFSEKHGGVCLVSVDEPAFGLVDDPLMDRGSEARENLLEAWESILCKAKAFGLKTSLHLHSTADELFWEAESLDIVESHVENHLYRAKRTKQLLESTDKFLKASVCTVDFDGLIRSKVTAASPRLSEPAINEKVAETWKAIAQGKANPIDFLEDTSSMKERLIDIIDRFGLERVPFAGPECGLKGFPSYECALECLRRVSDAVKSVAK